MGGLTVAFRRQSDGYPVGVTKQRMSLTVTLANFVSMLNPFRSHSKTETITGAEAVKLAYGELQDLTDMEYTATLSEPDIDSGTGKFVQNPKVVINIENTPFGDAGMLAFDLDSNELNELLDMFGLTIGEIEQLAGNEVPIVYAGGNPTVDWRRVHGHGNEEKSWDGDAIEDTQPKSNSDDEKEDDTGVNVTEQSVSPSSSESDPEEK